MQYCCNASELFLPRGVLLYAVDVTRHRQEGVRCGWQVSYVSNSEPDDSIAWLESRCSSPQSRIDHNGGVRGYVLCSERCEWAYATPSVRQVETPPR